MSLISDFPNELWLDLFSFLPLKSLISARGVNRNWRHLVPLANLHPVRRELLVIYDSIITTPDFLDTRQMIRDNLHHFDREAYVSSLEEKNDVRLPEEFRMWVLEWPARAVFQYLWPGLDDGWNNTESPGRPYGRCCLAYHVLDTMYCWLGEVDHGLAYAEDAHRRVTALALEVWEHGCAYSTWLILEAKKTKLEGTLVFSEGNSTIGPGRAGWHT
jgi:hypothetical protein